VGYNGRQDCTDLIRSSLVLLRRGQEVMGELEVIVDFDQ
jgi:hypothetical protein